MTNAKTIDLSGTPLRGEEQAAVHAFCDALQEALDVNLRSVSLYGSAARDDFRPRKSDINLLVVVERIDVAILKSVVETVAIGRRWGIAPFFITEQNLRASTDVFPVKFLSMQESHRVLVGTDILGGLEIRREHLRLRCEQEFKNVLLRLRRHYVMGGGHGLTDVMVQSIGGVMETIRAAVSLTREGLPPRHETAAAAAEAFGADAGVFEKVQALRKRRQQRRSGPTPAFLRRCRPSGNASPPSPGRKRRFSTTRSWRRSKSWPMPWIRFSNPTARGTARTTTSRDRKQ